MEKQERFPMPPNRHQNNNQTHLKGLTYLLSKCNLKSHNTSQYFWQFLITLRVIQFNPSNSLFHLQECSTSSVRNTLDTTSQGKSTHQKSAPIRQRKKCSLKKSKKQRPTFLRSSQYLVSNPCSRPEFGVGSKCYFSMASWIFGITNF